MEPVNSTHCTWYRIQEHSSEPSRMNHMTQVIFYSATVLITIYFASWPRWALPTHLLLELTLWPGIIFSDKTSLATTLSSNVPGHVKSLQISLPKLLYYNHFPGCFSSVIRTAGFSHQQHSQQQHLTSEMDSRSYHKFTLQQHCSIFLSENTGAGLSHHVSQDGTSLMKDCQPLLQVLALYYRASWVLVSIPCSDMTLYLLHNIKDVSVAFKRCVIRKRTITVTCLLQTSCIKLCFKWPKLNQLTIEIVSK